MESDFVESDFESDFVESDFESDFDTNYYYIDIYFKKYI